MDVSFRHHDWVICHSDKLRPSEESVKSLNLETMGNSGYCVPALEKDKSLADPQLQTFTSNSLTEVQYRGELLAGYLLVPG